MYRLIITTLLFTISSASGACYQSVTPDTRYELLNNNTVVRDKQTGLLWQRCSWGQHLVQTRNGEECRGTANREGYVTADRYDWKNALQAEKYMGNGWRIPSINELKSLMGSPCDGLPVTNKTYFPDTAQGFYWSSTPFGDSSYPPSVYIADFVFGVIFYTMKNNAYSSKDDTQKNSIFQYLRLVRSE